MWVEVCEDRFSFIKHIIDQNKHFGATIDNKRDTH